MKKIYLISFKCSKKEQLIQYIKASGIWYKFDENSFLISSALPFAELKKNLNIYMDGQTDSLLLLETTIQDYTGWQKKNIWDWFTSNNIPKR